MLVHKKAEGVRFFVCFKCVLHIQNKNANAIISSWKIKSNLTVLE